jgi:hypothetical protein
VYLLIFISLSLVCYSSPYLVFVKFFRRRFQCYLKAEGMYQTHHSVSKMTGRATNHFLQRRVLPQPNKKLKNFDLLTLKQCSTRIEC